MLSDSYTDIKKIEHTFSKRLVSAISFVIFLLLFLVAFVVVLFMKIAGYLLLRNFHKLNRVADLYWGRLRRIGAYTIGLFTAIFSPSLGYGIIVLYNLLQGSQDPDQMVSKVIRKHFQ